mgnify:CR=1 FL=1
MRKISLTIIFIFSSLILLGGCRMEENDEYPLASIETTAGTIKIELYEDKAPITVSNFKEYANNSFYAGTVFHRVIEGFMIQGGGFLPGRRRQPTGSPIKNEADNGLKNKRGTIAMARTSEIDSATSQFFINTVDNTFLDHRSNDKQGYGYAVFGKVIEGMDIVDKIEKTNTTTKHGMDDWPVENIVIESVSISR